MDDFSLRSAHRALCDGSAQMVLGTPMTLLSNRLSYQYGFEGPNMTVDKGLLLVPRGHTPCVSGGA